jgi:hypothetical protein
MSLPLKPHSDQLLLRLAYTHVQMVLYRPFIHHIAKRRTDPDFDTRAFACASACINAALQVVWLIEALEVQGVLLGSRWLLLFTTFLAVVCLLMFVLSNMEDPLAGECLSVASRGFNIISRFATSHNNARIYVDCLGVSSITFGSPPLVAPCSLNL